VLTKGSHPWQLLQVVVVQTRRLLQVVVVQTRRLLCGGGVSGKHQKLRRTQEKLCRLCSQGV
jgi:hypothetical protein